MVISSSTQWTIPLNGSPSSFSASSPCLTRQGSVLGLKTCQLSAPQHAINASSELHLHDLHSTSSRRLQGAEYAPSRRSAGSFRQLFHEDFSAKLGQEDGRPCPPAGSPPDWAYNNKESEGKYDGIAMPWSSSSPLRHVDADSAAAFNGNLVNVHGDITADDVDLLPMPGLLSCSSPFYADSYITHTQSPENTRSIEISSSESSANSSKSSVMVSNYLGLPPDFNPEIAGMVKNMCHASAPLTPPISIEHARGAENHFSNEVHAYNNKETDNFTDSLAGLWSNAAIGGDSEHMVHGSESLASIFNVYPQNFHDFSSSDQSCIDTCDNKSVQLIIDDLQYLVNPSIEGSEDRTKERESLHGLHEAGAAFSGHEKHKDMVLEATHAHGQAPNVRPTHAHGQSPNVTPQANASEQKSSIKARVAETSAMPHGLSSTARSNEETASPSKENGESLGIKRPFSALDLASMASSMMSTSAWSCGSNAWRPQPNCMGLPVLLKENEEPHSFSSFLYKFQKDPKLAGLHYHMATKYGGIMDEDSMPKPPPTKVRRKHGTAMDPQSVAARTRREKFSDRIRILQSLVPNGERLDTVSMLGQTLEYVRFLQHQVWELYHGKDPASSNTCEKWKDFIEAGLH